MEVFSYPSQGLFHIFAHQQKQPWSQVNQTIHNKNTTNK